MAILTLIYVGVSILLVAGFLYFLPIWADEFGHKWNIHWVVRLVLLLIVGANYFFSLYLAVQGYA